jgi:hypothetical protein
MGFALSPAQVYEFSKPNVAVNDDSLGRHQHFNISQGQHLVAFRGDTMYAVWWDYRQPGNPNNADVYFARSTDSGRSFLPNVRVNDNTDTTSLQQDPSLCLDRQGVIHVAWDDTRLGVCRIFYARSTDGGRSFLPNLRVNDSLGARPMVASNGRGIVCVAWFDGNADTIWLSRSTNNGQTFGRRVLVNDHLAYSIDPAASLALDSTGRAYVAWERNDPHVYLSRSTDPGDTLFYPSVRVSDSVPRVWAAEKPSLAVGKGSNIYVALEDKRNTGQSLHIYVAKSTDGGVSFLRNVDVSDDAMRYRQRWPSIAADDSGNVYVAWTDYRNGARCIYFARSTDPEDTMFSPNIMVNDTAGTSTADRYVASLAVNERGEAFITWSDNRVSRGPYDIYSSRGGRQTSGIESGKKETTILAEGVKCYPNPFFNRIQISYSVHKTGIIRVKVYNLLGEEVKDLESGQKGPGKYKTAWKGADENGREVKSGVYFIRLSFQESGESRRSSTHLQKAILTR